MSLGLGERVAAEMSEPVAPAVAAFAAELARIGGPGVAAVLFYGSALRTGALDGVLDFYVLTDRVRDWPQGRAAAAAGAWLPPNVEYREFVQGGRTLRAKVALMSVKQFHDAAYWFSRDTTIWARFAQPSALAWSRDPEAAAKAAAAVARAVASAAWWAAVLGPPEGSAQDYWRALFRETYRVELRIEPKGRERALLDADGGRYRTLLPLGWAAEGVEFEAEGERLRPQIPDPVRRQARGAWGRRRLIGKPLTVARRAKAVFTFQGAADYAAWKIERHTGVKVEVTAWRRKHPILAAPGVAWSLWRKGVLR
jgi:hypothetical protein